MTSDGTYACMHHPQSEKRMSILPWASRHKGCKGCKGELNVMVIMDVNFVIVVKVEEFVLLKKKLMDLLQYT